MTIMRFLIVVGVGALGLERVLLGVADATAGEDEHPGERQPEPGGTGGAAGCGTAGHRDSSPAARASIGAGIDCPLIL